MHGSHNTLRQISLLGLLWLWMGTLQADPTVSEGFTAEVFAEVDQPFHLSFDAAGNLYVGSTATESNIWKVSPDGQAVEAFGEAIFDPDAVIVDVDGVVTTLGPGSVLVGGSVDDGPGMNNRITEISSDGTITRALVEGMPPIMNNPQGMDIANGRLLWANCSPDTDSVGYYDGAVTGVFATAPGQACLGAVARAPDGRFFVTDFDHGDVLTFDADGNLLQGQFLSGLNVPDAMTFDRTGRYGGDLFVVERGANRVLRVDPVTGASEIFAESFDFALGIAVAKDGCVYVSENLQNRIWAICPDPPVRINAGMSDAWFNSATAGQGFFIIVLEDTGIIFMAWFTYDTERPPENVVALLGEPGHRWVTAQGPYEGGTAMLDVYLTEGGEFDSAEPEAVTGAEPIGTVTIVWHDCENATLTYDIDPPGVSGQIELTRIVPDNVALCQLLNQL